MALCLDVVSVNEDLWRTADKEPVAAQTRRRKWGWTGHTLRKPATNITSSDLESIGEEKEGKTQEHVALRHA